MLRSLSNRSLPKPVALLISLMLALYFVPFVASPASAVEAGGFEIEGDLVDSPAGGALDWNTVDTSSSDFATAVDNVNNSGQDTTTFQGSGKEFNLQNQAGGWPGWQ